MALIDGGCRKRERLADILDFEMGILLDDPRFGHPLRYEAGDRSYRYAETPYARHSAHLRRIDGNSLKPNADTLPRVEAEQPAAEGGQPCGDPCASPSASRIARENRRQPRWLAVAP